jgi:hypothetical protein
MAVTAAIKFQQGVTTDDPGRALFGVLGGGPVTCSNGDNTNVVLWTWTLTAVPPGSALPLGVFSVGPAGTFTPDVVGGYGVDLRVQDRLGFVAEVDSVFGIPEASGRFIPPFGAAASALNFGGQLRGWSPYAEDYFHFVDATIAGVTALGARDVLAVSTTRDGVPGTIAGFDIPTNSMVMIEVEIVALKDDKTIGMRATLRGGFLNNSNVITPDVPDAPAPSFIGGAPAWAVSFAPPAGITVSVTVDPGPLDTVSFYVVRTAIQII